MTTFHKPKDIATLTKQAEQEHGITDPDARRQPDDAGEFLPAVTTEARRAAGRYVSLASLGGRPGEHLQAFVTAAILWAEAERLERACFSVAEDALTGPKARWFDAHYAYQEAKEAEDAARAALLIVARNVVADATTTRPTQED